VAALKLPPVPIAQDAGVPVALKLPLDCARASLEPSVVKRAATAKKEADVLIDFSFRSLASRRGDKVSFGHHRTEPRAPDFPFMKLEARGAAPSRSRRRSTSCAPGRGER